MALYLAAEPGLYQRGVLWLIPPRGREKADCVLKRVGHTLKFWLMGQLIAMAAVGVLITLGLWVLGAPLPLVSGLLAALLEFVPNVGPALAAGIPTLLSISAEGRFVDGPSLAGAVLGWFLIVQMLESYLLTPLIQRKAVELPPALLIVTQISAAVILGPLGVAVAAPLVAAAMAASRELFVVGDPEHEDPKDRTTEEG
jgi:predicted PurR-regulated permease PerM